MPNLRKLLEDAGALASDAPLTEFEIAERLIVFSGRRHYRLRIEKPGGVVIVCGATGTRRDWVRDDYARLFGVDPKHVTVARIKRRSLEH